MLTQQLLKEILHYDPKTGVFTWKHNPGNKNLTGRVAGCNSKGYRVIGLLGVLYYEHRLAWLYVHGEWPVGQIDHRDTNRSSNRIKNLRDATVSQNQHNRTKKDVGVYKDKRCLKKPWMARIFVDGTNHSLGFHATKDEALAAYGNAKKEMGLRA